MKFILGIIIPLAALASACGKAERPVRHYYEINYAGENAEETKAPVVAGEMAAAGGMPDLPPEMKAPSLPLEWDTPEGWDNLGGSGMRIATLKIRGQECTILSFPGDVGGDEANIRRWLGQLGHTIDDGALAEFIASPARLTTPGGHDVRLFDFADILPADAPNSTLAAIIPVATATVFVKLTGEKSILAGQKSNFEALCRSLRLAAEAN